LALQSARTYARFDATTGPKTRKPQPKKNLQKTSSPSAIKTRIAMSVLQSGHTVWPLCFIQTGLPIPTKPPVYNGMIAPRDSWMMPPLYNEMIPPGAPRALA
jgi:hypothetical protein